MNKSWAALPRISSSALKKALASQPNNCWIAMSRNGKDVLASGSTPAEAHRRASVYGQEPALLLHVLAGSNGQKSPANGSKKQHVQQNGKQSFLQLPSLYRGIYKRVAQKIRVDPSYVSRVARGERSSTEISRALEAEIRRATHPQ
jgi:hypothetical protein